MVSLNHRLNPLFSIKECMTCGALYTADFCCSKGGLEDKILVPKPPQNCATCGDPVDGLHCQPCAFVRKCLNEGWYTIHDKNEIINTSESSNDNTNIVSAPQEPFVFNQDPGVNSSQSPLQLNHNCCYECGDSLDGIFCQQCTCKSCGNGAHIGYNCPPKAPIISNPEQCNQTINELPQTLPSVHPTCNYEDENSFTYDSKPNSFNDSPSVLTHPPQLQFETYLCELCGNNAHYGYDCPPQFPLVYEQEPCYNQNFNDNYFPQNSQSSSQQYNCCENCGGPHETFQCQPMNEDYYEQNSCYDPNSFGFDQFQPQQYTVNHPILNAQNEFLNSQNKLMEQMTSICDMVGQIMQKKEEERRIAEDQEEKEFDLEDIFQIQDVILREKLLKISHLVTNIESLKDNPTSDRVLKSSFPIPILDSDSFFEESNTSLSHLDNSLPKFETFSDHTEETRSGRLTGIVISDNSNDTLLELPEFESFHFDPSFPYSPSEPPDVEISLIIETDAPKINNFDKLNEDECFDPGGDEIDVEDDDSFTFVIRTFLPFLTYPVDSPFLCSFGNEYTIFDPGIST
ncbi:hypothetical protein Tco_0836662 [Tanacetum coccineum]